MIDPNGREEFLGALASLVSHELRTPLAVIAGYAELLERREDAETRREAAVRIRQASARLSRMIDDLVCAAELDAGTPVVQAETLDLRDEVADALERLAIPDSACSFPVAAEVTVLVEADVNHLRQALTNVLALACSGGRAVEIAIVREGGTGVLSVDGGAPEPGEDERAQRLALSVARRLIELNGGTLAFGDPIRVCLPLARAAA